MKFVDSKMPYITCEFFGNNRIVNDLLRRSISLIYTICDGESWIGPYVVVIMALDNLLKKATEI